MKIVHVTTHFTPFIGGLEQLVEQIATAQSAEHEVVVLTLQHDQALPQREKNGTIEIVRVPSWSVLPGQYRWPKPGFQKALRDLKPEVVFTHTRFFATSFLAGTALRTSVNCHWIHVEHGQNPVQTKSPLVNIIARLWDHTLGRWILRNADRVVAVSDTGKQFVQTLGAPDVQVIPTGVRTPDEIAPLPQKHRALFFGRMVREKGIQELVTAAKKCPEWQFELVGEGPLFDSETAENVTWTPAIGHDAMLENIQSADLIILPSWSESLSLAVLEAMAAGRAVLATDVGENSRLLSADWLVPVRDADGLADKLHELRDDFDALAKAGRLNYERVRQDFSEAKMIDAYQKIVNL